MFGNKNKAMTIIITTIPAILCIKKYAADGSFVAFQPSSTFHSFWGNKALNNPIRNINPKKIIIVTSIPCGKTIYLISLSFICCMVEAGFSVSPDSDGDVYIVRAFFIIVISPAITMFTRALFSKQQSYLLSEMYGLSDNSTF